MAERHEQEAGVGDQRHHGAAKHHQRKAPAPADTAEIGDPGAGYQRQEHDARPDVAMHQQIDRREADLQPVPRAGKAERPEQRRRQAADDAEKRRCRVVLLNESVSAARPLIHRQGLCQRIHPLNPRGRRSGTRRRGEDSRSSLTEHHPPSLARVHVFAHLADAATVAIRSASRDEHVFQAPGCRQIATIRKTRG
ncbi:hypothetical protein [Bradyrhizobium diazoefficiens]|uniref:hypothetical protein n=1 Tax=Bradyrhizobium diazoefficiens TaxID=1355477 RepID=UPI001FCB2E61|nr:hypothetical protein [Bradyrhizobium diazoefficiens]